MKDQITEFIKQSDIDLKIWNRIKWAFISILLLILIGYLFFEKSKGNCSQYYKFINEEYSGKVTFKYLNKNDHMNETIRLENNMEFVINPFDKTGYFDSIEVGDIVVKKRESLRYFVIKSSDTLVFETKEPDCEKYLKQ